MDKEHCYEKRETRLAFPHVMILLILLALISCLLTYIIPAGTYQFDENGYVDAGLLYLR